MRHCKTETFKKYVYEKLGRWSDLNSASLVKLLSLLTTIPRPPKTQYQKRSIELPRIPIPRPDREKVICTRNLKRIIFNSLSGFHHWSAKVFHNQRFRYFSPTHFCLWFIYLFYTSIFIIAALSCSWSDAIQPNEIVSLLKSDPFN